MNGDPEVPWSLSGALADAHRTAEHDRRPPLSAVRDTASRLTLLADQLVDVEVRLARAAGQTWAQIGDVLGTTRQAAHQRYGSTAALMRRLRADAGDAFRRADTEARRMGHAYLGTEHLLLGILPDPPAELARATTGLDITLRATRKVILETVGTARTPRPRRVRVAPRLQRAADLAGERSARSGRYEVSCADLVHGMIAEGGGIGVHALSSLGVDLDTLARRLRAPTG